MRRDLLHALVFLSAIAGCVSAFAPPIRAKGPHVAMHARSTNADCLACHPAATAGARPKHPRTREPAVVAETSHAPSTVPAWMVDDVRGCMGCHSMAGRQAR